MLVEIAIGDAYGAGFEYCDRKFIDKHHDLTGYVRHPWHELCPGCYTDDTQMSMALAELLLAGRAWTPENMAECFVEAFQRDPRKGYSKPFYSFLRQADTAELFLSGIRADSAKNGAAMRSVPVGVLPDINEVKARSASQAAVTHDTQGGVASAMAVSLMSHYFLYGLGTRDGLPGFIAREVPVPGFDWERPWEGEVGSSGLDTALAALWTVVRSSSRSEALKLSVALGGDVDTVAAIALGVVSCSREHERDLPAFLMDGLENGSFGRDYLIDLDVRLARCFSLSVISQGGVVPELSGRGENLC